MNYEDVVTGVSGPLPLNENDPLASEATVPCASHCVQMAEPVRYGINSRRAVPDTIHS